MNDRAQCSQVRIKEKATVCMKKKKKDRWAICSVQVWAESSRAQLSGKQEGGVVKRKNPAAK